jgi:two-component system, OmpR family, copper resistance phosphate regulon response regulator CusR
VARILIAEDDPLISSFIARGLRAHGYSVIVADDGAEAERWIATDDFDLIILDMALPYRSGFEVRQDRRAQQNPIPVLVLTGRPELKDAVARLDVGADDYMTKPFHFSELLGRVKTRLAQGTEPAAASKAQ